MADPRPEVSESDYVSDTRGPATDTEAFYAGTPAPGQRDHLAPPVAAATRDADRPDLRRPGHKVAAPASSQPLPWPWIAGGTLAAGLLGLGGAALWLALTMGAPPDGPAAAAEDENTWEGLKVKKGLR